MTSCKILLCMSLIINLATSSATVQSPMSSQEELIILEHMPRAAKSSNSTKFESRFGDINESPADASNIRFENNDSKRIISTIQDDLTEKSIARGVVKFALQLDFALSSEDYKHYGDKTNVVFSPACIAAALSLVLLGASGSTYSEIANVLGLVPVPVKNDDLHYHIGNVIGKIDVGPNVGTATYIAMANAIFVQDGYPIKERYERLSRDRYASEIVPVDFIQHANEAQTIINNWVGNKTYGHITNILENPPPPSTKIVIASALYFNGAWKYPFMREQTAWRPFYIEGSRETGSNQVVEIPMMVTGGEFPYYSDPILGCQVVGLPYKDDTVTMYLVLPDQIGYEGLKRLQYRMTVSHLIQLADSATERIVITAVPRMKIESTIQLKQALELLGVQALFDPYQADLSEISDNISVGSPLLGDRIGDGNSTEEKTSKVDVSMIIQHLEQTSIATNISSHTVPRKQKRSPDMSHVMRNNPGLYADEVIHKVTIDVTEMGTEAAASTVVSITRDGSHKVVRFERPFLFFIRHKDTGVIIFWGTISKPEPFREMTNTKSTKM